MVDLGATTILGRSPRATSGSDPVLEEGVEIVSAPRVLIAIEPRMYAEVLAFLVGRHRPDAEISLLGSSEELEDAALRLRPHLVVANRIPKAVREGPFFWVEQDEARGGEGAKHLRARIRADGYSESVEDVRIEHVLLALDRAERKLVLESEGMVAPAEPRVAQA